MNKFIFILYVITSITLRETFSQCLLFNEFKSQCDFNTYRHAIETKDNFYFVGDAIDDTDELAPKGKYISKCVVVKTDRCGNIIWKKFLGLDNAYESGLYIEKIGNYLYINGGTQEGARAATDFIAKLDEDGNTVWYKIYRKNNCDISCSRMFNENNNLVIYGSREITDIQGHVKGVIMYIYAIDTAGKLIWDKEYFKNYPSNYFHTLSLINNGYIGIVGISYNNNINKTIEGVLICRFDTFYNLKDIDTIKNSFYSGVNVIAYNSTIKKTAIHLTHWVNTDSNFCQIALLDSTGKVEKIIDDPQNFTPSCLIAYKDGWMKNYNTILIQYDANYKVVRKFTKSFGDEGFFISRFRQGLQPIRL